VVKGEAVWAGATIVAKGLVVSGAGRLALAAWLEPYLEPKWLLGRWKDLCDYLPRPSGRRSVMYPHLDDFASMLEALFVGPCQPLQRPMRLTELGWDLSELRFAVQRLKTRKCGDELGLTAELLKHAPEEFLSTLLTLYNNVLVTGERPESWCNTLFSMLPKKTRPLQPADFRPIANIRVLYKTFGR